MIAQALQPGHMGLKFQTSLFTSCVTLDMYLTPLGLSFLIPYISIYVITLLGGLHELMSLSI